VYSQTYGAAFSADYVRGHCERFRRSGWFIGSIPDVSADSYTLQCVSRLVLDVTAL
jgi:hypothetical protein